MGGSENGNFSLRYVLQMFFRSKVGDSKQYKNIHTNFSPLLIRFRDKELKTPVYHMTKQVKDYCSQFINSTNVIELVAKLIKLTSLECLLKALINTRTRHSQVPPSESPIVRWVIEFLTRGYKISLILLIHIMN